MAVGHEQLVDKVLVLDLGGRATAAAALLGLVSVETLGLGIATVRQGHHQILFRDQVLDREVRVVFDDFGAPLIGVAVTDFLQLFTDDANKLIRILQNARKVMYRIENLSILCDYLVTL